MKNEFIAAFALLAVTRCATSRRSTKYAWWPGPSTISHGKPAAAGRIGAAERLQGQSAALARADAHSKRISNTLPLRRSGLVWIFRSWAGWRVCLQCRTASAAKTAITIRNSPIHPTCFPPSAGGSRRLTRVLVVLAEGRNLDKPAASWRQ